VGEEQADEFASVAVGSEVEGWPPVAMVVVDDGLGGEDGAGEEG
jgi:hypothetical protein